MLFGCIAGWENREGKLTQGKSRGPAGSSARSGVPGALRQGAGPSAEPDRARCPSAEAVPGSWPLTEPGKRQGPTGRGERRVFFPEQMTALFQKARLFIFRP